MCIIQWRVDNNNLEKKEKAVGVVSLTEEMINE